MSVCVLSERLRQEVEFDLDRCERVSEMIAGLIWQTYSPLPFNRPTFVIMCGEGDLVYGIAMVLIYSLD